MKLKKIFLALGFCSLAAFSLEAQSIQTFPNIIRHMDCNGLLSGPYEIKSTDIEKFVKTDLFEFNLITYGGQIKPGLADNLSGLFINKLDHSYFTANTILYNDYKNHIQNFLSSLENDKSIYKNNLIISTYKKDNFEIITYFHFFDNRFIAYAHPIIKTSDLERDYHILNEEIKYAIENKHSIIWAGDEILLDIKKVVNNNNAFYLRRAINLDKPLPGKIEQFDKVFNPSNSLVCNSIPSTEKQLYQGGFPISKLQDWILYKNEVAELTAPHFHSQISNAQDLKRELLEGSSDVLFIVAHLKGGELFIGNDIVKISEIKNWGKRSISTNGKRTALLCICNSGNQNYKVGSLLWKRKIDALSNVFIGNHYFDLVIAPDHTILRQETISVLDKILKNKSLLEIQSIFKGWEPYVFLESLFDSKKI